MVSIATWNVNSVKARMQHVLDWLKESQVDIALLQELKCEDDKFPTMESEELGYNVATHGQKTYNGVAILSKYPLDDITRGIPNFEDEQARYIEASVSLYGEAIRVASIYLPNGQEVGSDKFRYKMKFFEALQAHAANLMTYDEAIVLGGDYNVAPESIDVYDPKRLDGTVCFHPDERQHFRRLQHAGWYDAFRITHGEDTQFSWWDYRGGSYQKGHGLRIDHLLLSPQATDRLQKSWVDETPRGWEKPSDHTPVLCELN